MIIVSRLTRRALLGATAVVAMAALSGVAFAADATLKIGFVGVTSGPAAAWGTSNVRSMQTLEAMYNEAGGVKIGDKTYMIEVVTFDDQKDPKRAVEGMEKMAQEGIHYVVGPNVDDGAAAVRPVAEKNNIIYFPYAFPKELYTAPASNAWPFYSRERLHQLTINLQLDYDRSPGHTVLLRSVKDSALVQPSSQVLRDADVAFSEIHAKPVRKL